MNPRRLAVPLLAVMMIVLAFFGLRQGRGGQKAGPEKQRAQKQAMVAKGPVPQGRKIGLSDLDSVPVFVDEWEKKVPPDAISDQSQLIGGTAKTNLAKGDFFATSNTVPAAAQVSQKVEPGFVAITIPAPPQPSLYDLQFLNPDDRVDVFGVTLDQQSGLTVSVRLASNARVLAIDKVISKQVEEKRKADLQQKIDEVQKTKQTQQAKTPPPSADVLKGMDDQIEGYKKEMNPKIENPSVTVEVTPAQSQTIALWRKTADLQIALHREEDVRSVVMDTASMLSPVPGGGAGEAGKQNPLATGHVLTIDDVAPLDQRNPEKYVQRQQLMEQQRQHAAEKTLEVAERDVRLAELRTEKRNIEKYGTRTAPAASIAPPAPRTAVPPPATVAPREDARVKALEKQVRDLRSAQAKKARSAGQEPLKRSVELYRGKDKSVVNY